MARPPTAGVACEPVTVYRAVGRKIRTSAHPVHGVAARRRGASAEGHPEAEQGLSDPRVVADTAQYAGSLAAASCRGVVRGKRYAGPDLGLRRRERRARMPRFPSDRSRRSRAQQPGS